MLILSQTSKTRKQTGPRFLLHQNVSSSFTMSTGEVELKEKVVDKKMIKGHRELRVAAPYKESRGKRRAGRGIGRGEKKFVHICQLPPLCQKEHSFHLQGNSNEKFVVLHTPASASLAITSLIRCKTSPQCHIGHD